MPRTPPVDYVSSRDVLKPGASTRGTVPGWVLGVTLKGRVGYDTPAGPVVSRPGNVMIARAGVLVAWSVPAGAAARDWECVYSVFQPLPQWRQWLAHHERGPGFAMLALDPENARRVRRALLAAHRFFKSALPRRIDLARNALERALICCAPHDPGASDDGIAAAVAFISASVDRPLLLAEAAKKAHLSRSQFCARFKQRTGRSPIRFHEEQRMQHAMQLLRLTLKPVKAIAAAVGFDDPHYFANRFRRHAGCSPRQYRVRMRA